MSREPTAQGIERWTVRLAVASFAVMMFGSLLASVVAFLVAGASFENPDLSDPRLLVGLIVGTSIGFLSGLAFAVRAVGWEPLRLRPCSPSDLAWAVAMTAPALALGYGFTSLLSALGVHSEPQQIVEGLLSTTSPSALSMGLIYSIFGAALLEEGLFRGVMQPPLVERFGAFSGIAMTGILFGLVHLSDPWALVPLTAIGIIAGWLRHRSGGLGSPIVFHACNNAIAMGLTVMMS